ncbi:DUF305 domain-containing protein [Streptomyces sp. NPDC102406]|uniref:DUF305 domain-containing protein n=1 Tax=Streptomyces sp. NPDC102406 TaxID=3366171 RepID=UPI00381A82A0
MTARRPLARRASAIAATAAAAALLAACGSNDKPASSGHDMNSMSSTPSAPAAATQGSHNRQDTAFAQGMIPHHRQAVAMADLAPSRAKSSDVKTLATTIKKAQDPEITTLSGWLKGWGEKVPAADGEDNMDHSSGHDMSGMMSADDMTKLEKLSGAAFDTAFLHMMVGHHQGAIDMAKTEQAKGAYGPAKNLAKSIIASQTVEITQMNKLLGK